MLRVISLIVAVLLLLGVGWFVGHRQVTGLERAFARDRSAWGEREAELLSRVNLAEARAMLRLAEAELLLASGDAADKNYGLAGSRTRRAQDLIIKAAGIPGMVMPLGDVRNQVEGAHEKVETADPRSSDLLRMAAMELRRILEQSGQA